MSTAIPNPRRQRVLFLVLAIVVLALLLPVIGSALLKRYLSSDKFLALANYGASMALNVDGTFQPLHWSTSEVYTDGFAASGRPGNPIEDVRLDSIRAALSRHGLWHRIWTVDGVTVRRLRLSIRDLEDDLLGEPNQDVVSRIPGLGPTALLLPRDAEVLRVSVREADVTWPMGPGVMGALTGTTLDAVPNDSGWRIEGTSGRVTLPGHPPLNLRRYKADYRQDVLYLTELELHPEDLGRISVTGEIDPARDVVPDLQVRVQSLPIAPWLSPDWRARLSGDLSGSVHVEGQNLSGKLALAQGVITAMPVLDEIATFTKAERFRRLVLQRATGTFRYADGRLEVSDFAAESEGLLRVEGTFTMVGEAVAAQFKVGVDPDTLRWIPGGDQKVFTEKRDGYAWTDMRVTGTVDRPIEDLSPRLLRAAGEAIVEAVAEDFEAIGAQVLDAAEGMFERVIIGP